VNVSPSDGGIITVDQLTPDSYPATYAFENGTSVDLEAVPASGYFFESWSGKLSGTTNPATVVIDCNKSITANFSPITTNQPSWPLVGGVIGGLVIVGLLVGFLMVKRRA